MHLMPACTMLNMGTKVIYQDSIIQSDMFKKWINSQFQGHKKQESPHSLQLGLCTKRLDDM